MSKEKIVFSKPDIGHRSTSREELRGLCRHDRVVNDRLYAATPAPSLGIVLFMESVATLPYDQ